MLAGVTRRRCPIALPPCNRKNKGAFWIQIVFGAACLLAVVFLTIEIGFFRSIPKIDQQTLRKVVQTYKVAKRTNLTDNTPYRGKLAFLFLLEEKFDNSLIWQYYFKGAPDAYYSIYLHPRPEVSAESLGWAAPYVIPDRVDSEWCTDLVNGTLKLIQAALQDPENVKYVFMSPTTVPIKSFDHVYRTLTEDDQTAMCIFPPWDWGWTKDDAHDYVVKHHQWAVLNRRDAQVFRHWTKVPDDISRTVRMDGCIDEHWLSYYLTGSVPKTQFESQNALALEAPTMNEGAVYWRELADQPDIFPLPSLANVNSKPLVTPANRQPPRPMSQRVLDESDDNDNDNNNNNNGDSSSSKSSLSNSESIEAYTVPVSRLLTLPPSKSTSPTIRITDDRGRCYTWVVWGHTPPHGLPKMLDACWGRVTQEGVAGRRVLEPISDCLLFCLVHRSPHLFARKFLASAGVLGECYPDNFPRKRPTPLLVGLRLFGVLTRGESEEAPTLLTIGERSTTKRGGGGGGEAEGGRRERRKRKGSAEAEDDESNFDDNRGGEDGNDEKRSMSATPAGNWSYPLYVPQY